MKWNMSQKKWEDVRASLSDKVAAKIVRFVLRIQTSVSNRVNKELSKLSVSALKAVFYIFCITGVYYCLFLIWSAIIFDSPERSSLQLDAVKTPRYFEQDGNVSSPLDSGISKATINEIQAFKVFLDSLRIHQPGKHDSIVRSISGLIDSIGILEELYYQQKKQ